MKTKQPKKKRQNDNTKKKTKQKNQAVLFMLDNGLN